MNVASILEKRQNRTFDGFYTEEVRGENGSRTGFDVVLIRDKEKRIPLARTELVYIFLFVIPLMYVFFYQVNNVLIEID